MDEQVTRDLIATIRQLNAGLAAQTAELRKLVEAVGRLVQPTGGPTVEDVAEEVRQEYTPAQPGVIDGDTEETPT